MNNILKKLIKKPTKLLEAIVGIVALLLSIGVHFLTLIPDSKMTWMFSIICLGYALMKFQRVYAFIKYN